MSGHERPVTVAQASARIVDGDLWQEWEAGRWAVIPTNRQRRRDGTAVMGAGVARAAAERFPGLDRRYGAALARGEDRLAVRDHRLLLVVTKDHYRVPSTIDEVRAAAEAVGEYARRRALRLVVPALGCGLGGLEWGSTAPVILDALGDVDALVLPPR